MSDSYWPASQAPYPERRDLYLEYCAPESPGDRTGFFSQIARLELGRDRVDEGPIRQAIAYVDSRQDCSDFSIAGLLRILYKYRDNPLISRELINDIERCVLGFKYWWDEPTEDPMCYWTENHQIIFHSDELLAGQLFPDRTFENTGTDGCARVAHALPRILRWFELRSLFGFSEWLSNCYFDEDLVALVNLRDFAADAGVRTLAERFIHLLLFEMALHSHRGVFGCTHGRTYPDMVLGGRGEPTSNVSKLMFGSGMFNDPACMSAVALATSGYRCPPIIEAIAADVPLGDSFRERHSIEVEDAPRYGLSYDNLEDGAFFWGIECFVHPLIRDLSIRMLDAFRVLQYPEFKEAVARYQQQLERQGGIPTASVDPTALTTVNIETFRTPDYLLSCAQDYRAAKSGYQQHVWQATLDVDAVVFTNHPGTDDLTSRPNYWAGNGRLPRVAQHRNVLVCLQQIPEGDPFPFSHAYFPHAAFDEVTAGGPWVCARKGDGFIALGSQLPLAPPSSGENADIELRADVRDNVWLCEMGTKDQWGDFGAFVRAIGEAQASFGEMAVSYTSPSLGVVEFAWEGPLRVAGSAVSIRDYPRFDNPYANAPFLSPQIAIRRDAAELQLSLGKETGAG